MSVYKLVCPACGSSMRIRSSEGQTPCFRSIYFQCNSLPCGATFSGCMTIDYELSPSGMEQPLLKLPLAPSLERQKALRDQRTPSA
ncbi:ogr/Delta-like zinc finger family protein [Pseudomonas sp. 5P_3.1_Bac2]|uniref:ogr/Delta-like zinc finger family protein n=1 Tax=Pseudomonas sp. 5P_3.1_Bac2 TaxID=2971617 RepID=UPI0021C63219|nr:ogr/Delta-like zinc finger family protein [Pseudomonas sp. 5P_3.1_Bac2]MCU1718685.1 ogr/Delta-like zinc finger family protein [Pseudomonas sp. 5P_3.1_Bac2]